MDEAKKLMRGLKDISPIFTDPGQEEIPTAQPLEIQILGVSSPEYDGDSLFLNAFFASQIASPHKACSLVSLLSRSSKMSQQHPVDESSESLGKNLQRYSMYWDEFNENIRSISEDGKRHKLKSRDIFIDFEISHLLNTDSMVRLLDKWILLLKPTAESLTEGYKLIKAGLAINPQIEFFITLEGKPGSRRGDVVFERFSDFVLQQLNFNLNWLGWVDFSDPDRHFASAIHPDLLLFQTWNIKPSLEKFALASWIESKEYQGSAVF